MNLKRLLGLIVLCVGCMGFAVCLQAQEKMYYSSPGELPGNDRLVKTAGFWISRHPSPDNVIMSPDEISKFNLEIKNRHQLTRDLTEYPESVSGDDLTVKLRSQFDEIKKKNYFDSKGDNELLLFYQDLESAMNFSSIPAVIEPQFGFILRYANQRFLPTTNGLFAIAGDLDFDELQNNALELATPVVILHKSFDSRWFYVQGPASEGWVDARDVGLCARKDILEYFKENESWAVIVKAKADLFADEQLTQHLDHVQMGTKLAQLKKQPTAGVVAVRIPSQRKDGRFEFKTVYVARRDVHDGVLPYTARNIYLQAFELLNQPYGWGGMYGEQDCSRFIQQVYAVVGLELPRDSKDQAKVGMGILRFTEETSDEDKLKNFQDAFGAVSVLTIKGHIMLYLGMFNERPFAIHAIWAYREPDGNDDRVRVISRIVVTDLLLGKGSKKGSLLKRLTGIRKMML